MIDKVSLKDTIKGYLYDWFIFGFLKPSPNFIKFQDLKKDLENKTTPPNIAYCLDWIKKHQKDLEAAIQFTQQANFADIVDENDDIRPTLKVQSQKSTILTTFKKTNLD